MAKPKLDNHLNKKFMRLSTNEKLSLLYPCHKDMGTYSDPNKLVFRYDTTKHYWTSIYTFLSGHKIHLTSEQVNEILVANGVWAVTRSGKIKLITPKPNKDWVRTHAH